MDALAPIFHPNGFPLLDGPCFETTVTSMSEQSFRRAHVRSGRWRQAFWMYVMLLPQRMRHRLFAGDGRHCVVCERSASVFFPHGIVPRENARCPHCGSLERHRLAWLAMRPALETRRLTRFAHFAPERCLRDRLIGQRGVEYISIDLADPEANVRADLESLIFPSEAFDLFCCNHVLEHVTHDRRAIAELWRITRLGGRGFVQVPLQPGPTIEDPSVTAPSRREQLFGQEDHVRAYGMDIVERFETVGFSVRALAGNDFAAADQRARLGLESADIVFVLDKTAP